MTGYYPYPQPQWPEPPPSTSIAWQTRIGERSYTYVALRILGCGWYLTGQLTAPLSWGALCYHFPPSPESGGRFLVLGVTGQVVI